MMVDMGLDDVFHHDIDIRYTRIFNAWIKDWESNILITRAQENEQRLLNKFNNIRFLDD